MSLKFEIFNCEIIAADQFLFSATNRAFRYGDGLFESIKVHQGKPLFFNDHVERLKNGLELLHLNWPSQNIAEEIAEAIAEFVKVNEQQNVRIRLIVYRDSTGFYTPKTDKICWHLSGDVTGPAKYEYQAQGIKSGLFRDELKSKTPISNVKTLNCLVSVLAGIYGRDHGWDEALMMNTSGNVIEATSSNLIIRNGKTYFTPPLSDGCLDGVMRKNVIKILLQLGWGVEEKSLTVDEVENADEMIITNAIAGVRWIAEYHGRKLENTIAEKIISELNK